MKLISVAALMFVSVTAFAGIDFSESTKLSTSLKSAITHAVDKACKEDKDTFERVYEVKTLKKKISDHADNVEVHYSTLLTVESHYDFHPRSTPLVVESVSKSTLVGGKTEVRLVYGCERGLNYQCIQDRLNAYNSDLYYDIDIAGIHAILTTLDDARHEAVVDATISCK